MDKKYNYRSEDFGDYHDNSHKLAVAECLLKQGKYEESISLLSEVRQYIDQNNEIQSREYLLAQTDALLTHASMTRAKSRLIAIALMESEGWGRWDDGPHNG